MAKSKKVRKRVTRDDVRSDAKGSGGLDFLKLPAGVDIWFPEKKGTYLINIVPYETTSESHPHGKEVGTIWYSAKFGLHKNVGMNKKWLVCPASLGKGRCPICEAKAKVDYNENQREWRELSAQQWTLFNIINPDDADKVSVFAMSNGKFANLLNKEVLEGDPDDAFYWNVFSELDEENEDKLDGRTLKTRFSDAKFEGNDYIEATKIDFVERDDMDEDDILDKATPIDNVYVVLSYDDIAKMMEGEDEEDEEEVERQPRKRRSTPPEDEDGDDAEEPPKDRKKAIKQPDPEDDDEPVKPKKKSAKKKVKTEPEPDEDDVPFDADDAHPSDDDDDDDGFDDEDWDAEGDED